jgi:hypothetical protein
MGKKFEVDGVVLKWVFRCEDRIGSPISVERPASGSFVIHVLGVKEGPLLWSNPFQELQQSLGENGLKLSSFFAQERNLATGQRFSQLGYG